MTLTADMFTAITASVIDAVEIIVVAGLGLMGAILVANMVPRLFKRFAR